jgi:integrase/recombinase XerC
MLIRYLQKKGRTDITQITAQDLDQYFRTIFDAGIKGSVRRSRASITKGFFQSLFDSGRIISNPARHIEVPSERIDILPAPPLNEDEVCHLIEKLPRRNAIDLRNRLHVELLYSCGLRISESLALSVRDIDLQREVLIVRHGKGDKLRQIPLMRGVAGALRDYSAVRRFLLQGPDHGALLLNLQGQRLTQKQFRGWFKELNTNREADRLRPIYPHLLRHSIAVHLLRAGADIRYIQEFLGHSHLNTTKIYLRLVPERLRIDYDNAMPQIAVGL